MTNRTRDLWTAILIGMAMGWMITTEIELTNISNNIKNLTENTSNIDRDFYVIETAISSL